MVDCNDEESHLKLTDEEIRGVKDFIAIKKTTVKVFIYIAAALAIWALKDIYIWVTSHLNWGS